MSLDRVPKWGWHWNPRNSGGGVVFRCKGFAWVQPPIPYCGLQLAGFRPASTINPLYRTTIGSRLSTIDPFNGCLKEAEIPGFWRVDLGMFLQQKVPENTFRAKTAKAEKTSRDGDLRRCFTVDYERQ